MRINIKSVVTVFVFVIALIAAAMPAMAKDADDIRARFAVGPQTVAFTTHEGELEVWALEQWGPDAEDYHWQLVLSLSSAEMDGLPTYPEAAILLDESADGHYQLHKLISGEYQVMSSPDAEGKIYTVVFDADMNYVSEGSFVASGS